MKSLCIDELLKIFYKYSEVGSKGWSGMEINDQNLQALSSYLQQTLNPSLESRKQGNLQSTCLLSEDINYKKHLYRA